MLLDTIPFEYVCAVITMVVVGAFSFGIILNIKSTNWTPFKPKKFNDLEAVSGVHYPEGWGESIPYAKFTPSTIEKFKFMQRKPYKNLITYDRKFEHIFVKGY